MTHAVIVGSLPKGQKLGRRNLDAEIRQLFQHLLHREPNAAELDKWLEHASRTKADFAALFAQVVAMPEYATLESLMTPYPAGHFYSPVVNPADLRDAGFAVDRKLPPQDLLGVDIDDARMRETFAMLKPHIASHAFSNTKRDGERYYIDNGIFPQGDAMILAAMIAAVRPRQIVEIGSGFSTACMLDCIERNGLDTNIICVEPYPVRLRANLTPQDAERVTIAEAMVQATDPEFYRSLDANDILFIDSTHVMKTGSDVCFELFEILPRLQPGVLVHLHDIQYPFEYPDVWIFEKRRSWNENYALRAFLMFNQRFKIIFFNNYFARFHLTDLVAAYGGPIGNPGSGIWLQVVGD